jgi:hypothetical protein
MAGLGRLLASLRRDALARAAFIVDDDGQIVAADAEADLQLEMLARTAIFQLGGVEGLRRQMRDDFSVLFHEVTGEDVCASALDDEHTVAVLFDQRRCSLPAVRACLKAHRRELLEAISNDPELT